MPPATDVLCYVDTTNARRVNGARKIGTYNAILVEHRATDYRRDYVRNFIVKGRKKDFQKNGGLLNKWEKPQSVWWGGGQILCG